MPPMGFSWCCDLGMAMLAIVIAVTIWACIALAVYIESGAWLAVTRLALILVCMILSRLCVAAVERGSTGKGVNVASKCMRQQNVAVVIGFSWGGDVVAEMLRLGLVGGMDQPAVLLIAPTTALVAKVAKKKDTPLSIRVPDDMSQRVHVFHGTDDKSFCPHSDRWESTGATFHLVHDNHVFCRRESLYELASVLASLIQMQNLVPA